MESNIVITPEMTKASQTLVNIHKKTYREYPEMPLVMTEEESSAYWDAMYILRGYNCDVHKEGKLSLRTKGYNEDRKAG